MKMFTNSDQTAKLIELGLPKPKNERWVLDVANESTPSIQNKVKRQDYSIGELLSFLPEFVNWTPRVIRGNVIEYSFETEGSELYYRNAHNELIDNLYDMILQLKEEGVI